MVAESCHCILYQTWLLLVILIINVKWLHGLPCLSCNDAVLPTECDTVKRCGPHENCFTEMYVSDSGIIRYHLGCKNIHQCPPQNETQHSYSAAKSSKINYDQVNTAHRRSQDLPVCSECCNGTICNNAGCGHPGYRSPRGPVCFHCPQQRTPDDCDKITVCGINQMCMLKSIESSVTHDMLYQTKCEEEVACSVTIPLIGKRRKRQLNASCCREELCNLERNSTSSTSVFPLTSPVPVTVNYPCMSTNPCVRGTCSPDNDTYNCVCENGFSGRHCDQSCGQPSSIPHGNFSIDEGSTNNHNATYRCDHGYQLSGRTVLTCNESGKWNDNPPNCTDINECLKYPCHHMANCSNTEGSFTCTCNNGFKGPGDNCEDINECADKALIMCKTNESQTERCINLYGSYFCYCAKGWTGTYCEHDINECDVITPCGVEATCTNFQGGYTCTCETGFPQEDPKIHCYKPVLVVIETPGSWYQMNDELLPAANIPYRMPYLNYEFSAYRPSMNGYFLLDASPLYENYGPQNPHDWQMFSYGKTVIAPLWTDLDATGGQGGLEFNLLEKYSNYGTNDSVHRDLTMLGVLFSTSLNVSDFDPRVAIVATWKNITRWTSFGPKENIKRENISMQAILVSDGIHTYLMFNYDRDQWSLKPLSYAPAAAGYSNQDKTGNIIADNHNFSTLNNRSNVGIAGRYIYNVSFGDHNRVAQLINDTKCLKFHENKTIERWIKENQALSYPCPCSENRMQLDYTYRVVPALYGHPQIPLTCYEAWFFNIDNVKQTCCYRLGALQKEGPGGGFATFDPDTFSLIDRFYECCSGDKHLCHLFYEMSPSDDCSRFKPSN